MTDQRYPHEQVDWDDGTMPDNVDTLRSAVVGRRIVKAERVEAPEKRYGVGDGLILTLDDGSSVELIDTYDCCAFTQMEAFFLDPNSVDHVILGVGTTNGYTTWHIYADFGDVMRLAVDWDAGNPFYYGYGFHIHVRDAA